MSVILESYQLRPLFSTTHRMRWQGKLFLTLAVIGTLLIVVFQQRFTRRSSLSILTQETKIDRSGVRITQSRRNSTLKTNDAPPPTASHNPKVLRVEKNPIPPKQVLEQMSHTDVQAFYHSYINAPQETCSSVLRMGLITDGGWEQCDDPKFAPNRSNCLVYSYGINFDFSYDDEMAAYGCEIHAFDPSMKTRSHLRGKRVHFHDTGVSGSDIVIHTNHKGVPSNWQLYKISTQRKLLNHTKQHRRLDIVKMDVEGYELDSLMAALDDGSLSDVRQLNFETHVNFGISDPPKQKYLQFLELLRKVYDKGFRIYLTHRNYVWSSFVSKLSHGKKRVLCHEVHTVNVNHINSDWPERERRREQQWQQQLQPKSIPKMSVGSNRPKQ